MKNISFKSKRRRQSLLQAGLVLMMAAMALGLVFGNQGLLQMWRIGSLRAGFEEEIARLTQEIARAHHEKALLKKHTYLERVVRKEMGYIENGETIFILPEFP